MMIIAFVGTVEDTMSGTIRGIGKTAAMTLYSYYEKTLKNRKIYTNYYTDFSDTIESCQNILNHVFENKQNNSLIALTEMHNIINSLGSKNKQVQFIDKFASQIRKLDCDMLYDTQRFHNIHIRLQLHTDVIFLMEKRHLDGNICRNDRCKLDHEIYIYRYLPYYPYWLRKFNPAIIGQHYDSGEVVYDQLNFVKGES